MFAHTITIADQRAWILFYQCPGNDRRTVLCWMVHGLFPGHAQRQDERSRISCHAVVLCSLFRIYYSGRCWQQECGRRLFCPLPCGRRELQSVPFGDVRPRRTLPQFFHIHFHYRSWGANAMAPTSKRGVGTAFIVSISNCVSM